MAELSQEEILEAQETNQEIEKIASQIQTFERTIASSWVRIGSLSLKIRQKKYWQVYGHHSFGSFVASLEPKINRERSQVYLCIGVVETLSSQIDEDKLEEMGISKANELKKYAKESGKLVPEELLKSALDSKKNVKVLRAEIADALHKTLDEKGTWYDFGGFYVTEDEKQLIEDTIELAKSIDPVILHDIPDHCQRKEVLLRWCMEFQACYGGRNEQ